MTTLLRQARRSGFSAGVASAAVLYVSTKARGGYETRSDRLRRPAALGLDVARAAAAGGGGRQAVSGGAPTAAHVVHSTCPSRILFILHTLWFCRLTFGAFSRRLRSSCLAPSHASRPLQQQRCADKCSCPLPWCFLSPPVDSGGFALLATPSDVCDVFFKPCWLAGLRAAFLGRSGAGLGGAAVERGALAAAGGGAGRRRAAHRHAAWMRCWQNMLNGLRGCAE